MSSELSLSELTAIRELCDMAFDGGFDDTDFLHALGGAHALVYLDGQLIAHAAVVPRMFVLGPRPADVNADRYVRNVRCAYVEAVATDPRHRRAGHGSRVMGVAENVMSEYGDFGALAASEKGRPLYERRGWRRWRGPLYARTPAGRMRTPDNDGAIYVFGDIREVDVELTCDYRSGDLW